MFGAVDSEHWVVAKGVQRCVAVAGLSLFHMCDSMKHEKFDAIFFLLSVHNNISVPDRMTDVGTVYQECRTNSKWKNFVDIDDTLTQLTAYRYQTW